MMTMMMEMPGGCYFVTEHTGTLPMTGMKTKIREVITLTDKDHHTFEFYENRGGNEVMTMEINYTRKH